MPTVAQSSVPCAAGLVGGSGILHTSLLGVIPALGRPRRGSSSASRVHHYCSSQSTIIYSSPPAPYCCQHIKWFSKAHLCRPCCLVTCTYVLFIILEACTLKPRQGRCLVKKPVLKTPPSHTGAARARPRQHLLTWTPGGAGDGSSDSGSCHPRGRRGICSDSNPANVGIWGKNTDWKFSCQINLFFFKTLP